MMGGNRTSQDNLSVNNENYNAGNFYKGPIIVEKNMKYKQDLKRVWQEV